MLELLGRFSREQGLTIVMVTHDAEVARHADRTVVLRVGAIIADERKLPRVGGGAARLPAAPDAAAAPDKVAALRARSPR